jgi:hypothetical protein
LTMAFLVEVYASSLAAVHLLDRRGRVLWPWCAAR